MKYIEHQYFQKLRNKIASRRVVMEKYYAGLNTIILFNYTPKLNEAVQ